MKNYVLALILTIVALATGAKAQSTTVQVPYNGTVPSISQTVPYSGTVPVTVVCPSGTATVNGTTITCPATPIPPIPPITSRTPFTPSGGNDQLALYAAAQKGPVEVRCVAPFPCVMKLLMSGLPNNADIYFDDGLLIEDFSAFTGFAHLFAISNSNNIKLTGSGSSNAAMFTMPLTYAKNFGAGGFPVNMCIWMENSINIYISGLNFKQCGGDSIYIGKGSNTVHVTHVISNDPVRNGLSLTDELTNVLIDYSTFTGAHNKAAGIMDGIDIEPNGCSGCGAKMPLAGQFTKQVVIDHVLTPNNGQDGICFCFYFMSSVVPLDYTVTNSDSSGNGETNFEKSNWPSPMTGPIQTVKGSGNKVNGVAITFP